MNDGTAQNILVATSAAGGVIASHDGGASWSRPSGVADDARSYSLRGTPADPGAFYLGSGTANVWDIGPCHRTMDRGVTWSYIGNPEVFEILEADLADANVVFGIRSYSAPLAVDRSSDGGDTFQPFDSGLEGGVVPRNITWKAGDCTTLLLATTAGLFARWWIRWRRRFRSSSSPTCCGRRTTS